MCKYRIGQGSDIHILIEERDFILGGIKIPYEKGFKAHSDGDVLIHAIIDSLLGALNLDDIGTHFPDNDKKYKDINSSELLENVMNLIREKGWEINNIDTTIHAERPKLRAYISEIKNNLAKIMNISVEDISIKAKTGEGADAVGEGLAVRCDAIALVVKK